MNQELLRKLKLEAGGSFFEHVNSDIQEKFAELIVKECMTCATWVGKNNTQPNEPQQTAHTINQRIKRHFGVE